MSATRILELDGIRGIAILLVLFSHFGVLPCPFAPLREAMRFGWVGVDLFFALSGFLITGILLDSLVETDYFGRFYLHRALRIFPVYYAFLIFMFHVGPLLSHLPFLHALRRSRGEEWWYWFYLSNWSPFPAQDKDVAHI